MIILMQKGTAALFLLVGLFIVGLIGIFFVFSIQGGQAKLSFPSFSPLPPIIQSGSNPVSNLSTYSNQKLGFELQHPRSVAIKEDTEEDFNRRGNGNFRKNFAGYVGYEPGKFLGAVAVLDKTNSFDDSPFTVWVFDNPENLDGAAWFEKYWYYPFLWGVFFERDKGHVRAQNIATISGQTTKYAIVSYQPGSPRYFFLTSGNRIFLFRIITSKDNFEDEILSSFKFL